MNRKKAQPDGQMARADPPGGTDRQEQGGFYAFLPALMLLGCLVLLAVSISLWSFTCLRRAGLNLAENRMEPAQAGILVSRGDSLLDQSGTIWAIQLASGRTTVADYLLRLFISPRYLAGGADDWQFIQDLHFVLSGETMQQAALDLEADKLQKAAGRLHYINEVLANKGYSGQLDVSPEPTRLRSVTYPADLPRDGQEVVGRLPVNVQARLEGHGAVFRLYADGQLVDERKAVATDSAGEQTYRLDWQTGWTGSGTHQLSLLVLSSDGRGRWQDIALLRVPEIRQLRQGSVQVQETGGWYQVEPWQDGSVRLNILDAGTMLAAQLYTSDNQLLAETASAPGQPGALLAQPAAEGPYYVRIGASRKGEIETDVPAACTLVCAPAAARDPQMAETWLPVISLKADAVQVRDTGGQLRTYPPDQLQIHDPEARLSSLSLRLPDGRTAALTPDFTSETRRYVLWVAQDADRVTLNYTTMEGSAAQVAVSVAADQSEQKVAGHPAEVPLKPALNHLELTVRGFSGQVRTYQLHILRPPDAQGLSTMLEPFPQDYRLPLLLLHIEYPAYRFEVQRPGIEWQAFLDAQDSRDRSLIDANHVPASWVRADSPVYDGASWKAAARPVIAYYGDPRNFLDPVNVFQFEKLSYLPDLHTRAGVEQILKGTFMEAGRSAVDYADLILEAGQDADISPFFLAARIIQEMGNQGQSPLSSGTLAGYEGVYNFYNIGATPNPDVPDGARINGARFALYGRNPDLGEITPEEEAWLLPWTSPRRAIIGGARWIAERYVAIGQDTLYGQKFDLVAEDGLFIRQYAQNIQMAWAEGRRTRRAWQDLGLIQEAFTFRIPVYENRPARPAALP